MSVEKTHKRKVRLQSVFDLFRDESSSMDMIIEAVKENLPLMHHREPNVCRSFDRLSQQNKGKIHKSPRLNLEKSTRLQITNEFFDSSTSEK